MRPLTACFLTGAGAAQEPSPLPALKPRAPEAYEKVGIPISFERQAIEDYAQPFSAKHGEQLSLCISSSFPTFDVEICTLDRARVLYFSADVQGEEQANLVEAHAREEHAVTQRCKAHSGLDYLDELYVETDGP